VVKYETGSASSHCRTLTWWHYYYWYTHFPRTTWINR